MQKTMKHKKAENSGEINEKITRPAANKVPDNITIENHKQAAAHNMEAAKYHLEAVKHYEAGNHKKAARSTVLAYGHHAIAGDFLNDDAKHHAQALKQTNYHD